MATLVRFGRVQIRMFADDHLPPHFHVCTSDGEALVLIDGLRVVRGRLRKHDFEVAIGWARNNMHLIRDCWDDLNG